MLYILYFYSLASTFHGKGISGGWSLPCALNPESIYFITYRSYLSFTCLIFLFKLLRAHHFLVQL